MKHVYVDQQAMRENKQSGNAARPPCRVLFDCEDMRAHGLEILGSSRILYRPEAALESGSRLWLETEAAVKGVGSDGQVIWELPAE